MLLYSFRFLCSEVVTAMPVNGGVYNHFLNTTRKTIGAFGACLSLLDYLGTYGSCSSLTTAVVAVSHFPLLSSLPPSFPTIHPPVQVCRLCN